VVGFLRRRRGCGDGDDGGDGENGVVGERRREGKVIARVEGIEIRVTECSSLIGGD